MNNFIQNLIRIDRTLFVTINQSHLARLNRFFITITNLGGVSCQILLVLGFLLIPATTGLGLRLGIVQLVVTGIVQLIKVKVARVRPYTALAGITPFKTEKDYSFPSGHTAASFATAITIAAFLPVLSLVFLGIAVLVGYSRIYIGVHYPLDVIVGGLLGSGLAVCLLIFLI